MRISDWSSDVCSSDLSADVSEVGRAEGCFAGIRCRLCGWRSPHDPRAAGPASALPLGKIYPIRVPGGSSFTQDGLWINLWISRSCRPAANVLSSRLRRVFRFYRARSEEHTSARQSLMRISYAVFCLKQKQITKTTH